MTDKELIKQEIERLINDRTDGKHVAKADITSPKRVAYLDILNFIDTLPEESTSEDLENEIDRFAKTVVPSRSKTITKSNLSLCAKHFAEWQHGKDFDDLLQSEMKFPKEFYEKGRFDMREEMMKALIGGEIVKDMHNQLSVKSEPIKDTFNDLKFGDKVKLIIIKDEHNTTTKD